MKLIYVSSPYTLGNKNQNVRRQIDVGTELINLGYCPFLPLLNHYVDLIHPQSYDVWLEQDIEMLKRCDAIIRLSGESKGADIEVAFAHQNNIPVFYNIETLNQWFAGVK